MEAHFSPDDYIPLLFQSGYLAIKETIADEQGDRLYRLGLPNGEVRSTLVDQLMPRYMGITQQEFSIRYGKLKAKFTSGDVPDWMEELK
ncbi:MAG: hypothetical protein LIO90_03240 [Bacteroidales bacterium]|nr:hypothetical protein [Bacteroidales bacterium]